MKFRDGIWLYGMAGFRASDFIFRICLSSLCSPYLLHLLFLFSCVLPSFSGRFSPQGDRDDCKSHLLPVQKSPWKRVSFLTTVDNVPRGPWFPQLESPPICNLSLALGGSVLPGQSWGCVYTWCQRTSSPPSYHMDWTITLLYKEGREGSLKETGQKDVHYRQGFLIPKFRYFLKGDNWSCFYQARKDWLSICSKLDLYLIKVFACFFMLPAHLHFKNYFCRLFFFHYLIKKTH